MMAWVGVTFLFLTLLLTFAWMDDAAASSHRLNSLYSINRASAAWNVDVWINDQPALRLVSDMSTVDDVASFVVDGENTIRIVATRNPDYTLPVRHCDVRFLRTDDPSSADWEIIAHLAENPGDEVRQLKLEEEFTDRVPFRWNWQDAQPLSELSEKDRAEIHTAFERIAEASRRWTPEKIVELQARWFPGETRPRSPYPIVSKAEFDAAMLSMRKVVESKGYTVEIAPREDRELIVGSRLVLLRVRGIQTTQHGTKPRKLMSGRVKNSDGNFDQSLTIGTPRMYAFKQDKTWKLLNFDWRFSGMLE